MAPSIKNGNAAQDIDVVLVKTLVPGTAARFGQIGRIGPLKRLGKRPRTTHGSTVDPKRHVNTRRRLVNRVELILIALLIHEHRAAHRSGIFKAARLDPDIHIDLL